MIEEEILAWRKVTKARKRQSVDAALREWDKILIVQWYSQISFFYHIVEVVAIPLETILKDDILEKDIIHYILKITYDI